MEVIINDLELSKVEQFRKFIKTEMLGYPKEVKTIILFGNCVTIHTRKVKLEDVYHNIVTITFRSFNGDEVFILSSTDFRSIEIL